MPSKWSHAVGLVEVGAVNSVRNQNEQRYGLSAGMSRVAKTPLLSITKPGNDFRFIPKSGSGRVLSVTNAPTTVPGTSAACHLEASKPTVEICSPLAPS